MLLAFWTSLLTARVSIQILLSDFREFILLLFLYLRSQTVINQFACWPVLKPKAGLYDLVLDFAQASEQWKALRASGNSRVVLQLEDLGFEDFADLCGVRIIDSLPDL